MLDKDDGTRPTFIRVQRMILQQIQQPVPTTCVFYGTALLTFPHKPDVANTTIVLFWEYKLTKCQDYQTQMARSICNKTASYRAFFGFQ